MGLLVSSIRKPPKPYFISLFHSLLNNSVGFFQVSFFFSLLLHVFLHVYFWNPLKLFYSSVHFLRLNFSFWKYLIKNKWMNIKQKLMATITSSLNLRNNDTPCFISNCKKYRWLHVNLICSFKKSCGNCCCVVF